MDFSLKKLHFKFIRYILSRPYPFDHWLTLFITYSNLWIYSFIYSLIFSLILQLGKIFFKNSSAIEINSTSAKISFDPRISKLI